MVSPLALLNLFACALAVQRMAMPGDNVSRRDDAVGAAGAAGAAGAVDAVDAVGTIGTAPTPSERDVLHLGPDATTLDKRMPQGGSGGNRRLPCFGGERTGQGVGGGQGVGAGVGGRCDYGPYASGGTVGGYGPGHGNGNRGGMRWEGGTGYPNGGHGAGVRGFINCRETPDHINCRGRAGAVFRGPSGPPTVITTGNVPVSFPVPPGTPPFPRFPQGQGPRARRLRMKA